MQAKTMGLIVLAAVVTALVVTFVQRLLFGESSIAVTSGAAGGVAAAIAYGATKKKTV